MFDRACPFCERVHIATEPITFAHHQPVEGDLSICNGCGGIGVYVGVADLLEVEKASDEYLNSRDEETKLALWDEQHKIRFRNRIFSIFGVPADE